MSEDLDQVDASRANLAEKTPSPESKTPTYEIKIKKENIEGLEIPEQIRDWLMCLPEALRFDKPVTLIVGENGSGKTSMAKAILNARARAAQEKDPKANVFDLILDKEEPAALLRNVLECTEERRGGNFEAYLIEGTDVISRMRDWQKGQMKLGQDRMEVLSGGSYTHRLSTRQLVDQALGEIKEGINKMTRSHAPHIDFMFDEPEQGMSPRRQLELPREMAEFIEEGDTLLVPTNNLALYLSDLPRLDLNQPERGVFQPSEYGEFREIKI